MAQRCPTCKSTKHLFCNNPLHPERFDTAMARDTIECAFAFMEHQNDNCYVSDDPVRVACICGVEKAHDDMQKALDWLCAECAEGKTQHENLLAMFNQANAQRGQLIGLLRETRDDLSALVVMLRNEMTGNLDEGLRALNCNALAARVKAIDAWFTDAPEGR